MPNPDPDSVSWIRFVLASATVIGLMGLLAFALRFVSMRGWIKPRASDNRLQITSTLQLDTRRRLVVAKWDEKEYLLLLSPMGDKVVSSHPSLGDPQP